MLQIFYFNRNLITFFLELFKTGSKIKVSKKKNMETRCSLKFVDDLQSMVRLVSIMFLYTYVTQKTGNHRVSDRSIHLYGGFIYTFDDINSFSQYDYIYSLIT